MPEAAPQRYALEVCRFGFVPELLGWLKVRCLVLHGGCRLVCLTPCLLLLILDVEHSMCNVNSSNLLTYHLYVWICTVRSHVLIIGHLPVILLFQYIL